MSELYWSPVPPHPIFQPEFAGAQNCRVCTVAADGYYGMQNLPNLASLKLAQYYSGALIDCNWHEDFYGIARSINLDSQNPGNFIEIASDESAAALDAIVGGTGSVQPEQTIFFQGRKLPGTTMYAVYGNWTTDPTKYSSTFFIWLPQSAVATDRLFFWWGNTFISALLPATISQTTDHFWCVTVGARGYEVWRDGYLVASASTADTPSLVTNYSGNMDRGPAVCEGWQGSKLLIEPAIFSGTFSFKLLYTMDRQLEWDEINCYFNDPYGLIRPKMITPLDKLGPLNNRIEITTPVVVVAEAQALAASTVDSPELTTTEVVVEAQSPALSAADVVILALAEVLMDAQSPTISEVASVEPVPIEVAIEAQVPTVSAVDAVRLLPAVIEMDANALSADAIVSIITKAAEVIFGMARFDISTEDDLFYTHKQTVHNALVAAINQGIFLPVTYDPVTKLMSIPEDESDAIPPASLAANELTCLFGLPERNRRDRIMERNTWRWQAIVKFHREVVLELFEEAVLAEPILIAQDDTKSLRQITLHLIDADYIHPPKQSSSSGTQVIYTFEARLGPV